MTSLLIGTCDSYSYLWENFIDMCDRHWLVDCDKIFVSETIECGNINYKTHLPGNLEWSDRMISGIKTSKSDYIFFILEDYFFTEEITEREVALHIDFMKEYGANKVMLEPPSHQMRFGRKECFRGRVAHRLLDDSDYLTSIQPSVWRKDYLLSVLKKGWNPWQFEVDGTNAIRGKDNKIYTMSRKNLIYWNAVRRGGVISPGWTEIQKKFRLKDI